MDGDEPTYSGYYGCKSVYGFGVIVHNTKF